MTGCPERPVVSDRTKADTGYKRPVLSGVLMHRTNRTAPRTRLVNRHGGRVKSLPPPASEPRAYVFFYTVTFEE